MQGFFDGNWSISFVYKSGKHMDKETVTHSSTFCIENYRYGSEDLLGSGFESQVYRAHHRTKKFDVALKIVDVEKLGEGINKQLFESEIRCLEALKSTPHVINLHEVIRTEDKIYVVTELCFGDFETHLKNNKISSEEAWSYMQQIMKGYKYLYEKDIIHRDLKPGNLFFNVKKELKIGDFGFAATTNQARKQTYYNIGSPAYMAPEIINRNSYSQASDIWALGIIYYEMLTGELPWTVDDEDELVKQMNESFIKSALVRPEIDQPSRNFLQAALAIKERDRLTVEQFLHYELGKDIRQDPLTEIKIHINGKKIDFDDDSTADKLSSEKTSSTSPNSANTSVQYDSPRKGPHNQIAPKTFDIKKINQNLTVESPKKKSEKDKQGRRNSFQIPAGLDFLCPAENKTRNYSPRNREKEEVRKKRKSADASTIQQLIQEEGLSRVIKVEDYVDGQVRVMENILIYLKNLELIGPNERWNSEIYTMKVCLRDVVASVITKNQDIADSLKGLADPQSIKNYIETRKYTKHQAILKEKQESLKKNSSFVKNWNHVNSHTFSSAVNGIMVFLGAVKTLLADSRRQLLKVVMGGCELVLLLTSLSKLLPPQDNEFQIIFEKSTMFRRGQVLSRISEILQCKPGFL